MSERKTLYVAGFVAASLAYIFVTLAFTGRFDVVRWSAFAAYFLVAFYAFERFIGWAERLD
ncbi:hypothetical protein [Halanaeroarchaeum sulfurireducens]|uniref:Uncharacterized protein n=1 Tax=Halanaeroarchaeum sulfurireducens TaxID=1604004 RepID=A0A0F7PBV0_9EURY|nr:hypothetical protein [Halanaeroarchaeum sulfurireducens]AKH98177.1 hypothetical protein HLASF_1701 [Halanaeroarchaeum sulfurireducens]ALG82571.1 hypothetical protein HLASA_1688 [Halanaeroarchaeum sulfurireducens]